MTFNRKIVIGVVINLPKKFAPHFGHVTRNDITIISCLLEMMGFFRDTATARNGYVKDKQASSFTFKSPWVCN